MTTETTLNEHRPGCPQPDWTYESRGCIDVAQCECGAINIRRGRPRSDKEVASNAWDAVSVVHAKLVHNDTARTATIAFADDIYALADTLASMAGTALSLLLPPAEAREVLDGWLADVVGTDEPYEPWWEMSGDAR